MLKILKYAMYFGFLTSVGILLGCFVHGLRTNQTTVMSGVAFVRELPYGERTVGVIETAWFSYWEEKNLKDYEQKHPNIRIDPEVQAEQRKLFQEGGSNK